MRVTGWPDRWSNCLPERCSSSGRIPSCRSCPPASSRPPSHVEGGEDVYMRYAQFLEVIQTGCLPFGVFWCRFRSGPEFAFVADSGIRGDAEIAVVQFVENNVGIHFHPGARSDSQPSGLVWFQSITAARSPFMPTAFAQMPGVWPAISLFLSGRWWKPFRSRSPQCARFRRPRALLQRRPVWPGSRPTSLSGRPPVFDVIVKM